MFVYSVVAKQKTEILKTPHILEQTQHDPIIGMLQMDSNYIGCQIALIPLKAKYTFGVTKYLYYRHQRIPEINEEEQLTHMCISGTFELRSDAGLTYENISNAERMLPLFEEGIYIIKHDMDGMSWDDTYLLL